MRCSCVHLQIDDDLQRKQRKDTCIHAWAQFQKSDYIFLVQVVFVPPFFLVCMCMYTVDLHCFRSDHHTAHELTFTDKKPNLQAPVTKNKKKNTQKACPCLPRMSSMQVTWVLSGRGLLLSKLCGSHIYISVTQVPHVKPIYVDYISLIM